MIRNKKRLHQYIVVSLLFVFLNSFNTLYSQQLIKQYVFVFKSEMGEREA